MHTWSNLTRTGPTLEHQPGQSNQWVGSVASVETTCSGHQGASLTTVELQKDKRGINERYLEKRPARRAMH